MPLLDTLSIFSVVLVRILDIVHGFFEQRALKKKKKKKKKIVGQIEFLDLLILLTNVP